MTDEAGRKSNRELFPFAASVLDELRAIFGPDTRIVYAEENGRTVGKPGPQGVRPNIEKRKDKIK